MWQGTYPILDFLTHGTVEGIQTWSPEDWGQVPSLPQRATGPWANPLQKQMGQRQGPLAMWCSILWLLFFGAGGWAELMIWISHNCWTKQTWGPKPCAKPVGGRCQPQGRNEEQGGVRNTHGQLTNEEEEGGDLWRLSDLSLQAPTQKYQRSGCHVMSKSTNQATSRMGALAYGCRMWRWRQSNSTLTGVSVEVRWGRAAWRPSLHGEAGG